MLGTWLPTIQSIIGCQVEKGKRGDIENEGVSKIKQKPVHPQDNTLPLIGKKQHKNDRM